jgi:6,7-dimethyl-8-ribityllumazine synthase
MSLEPPDQPVPSGQGFNLAIVAARYNARFVEPLLERVRQILIGAGVQESDLEVLRVPGSAEVPYACGMLADTKAYDAIVALGVVVAGETHHHELIGQSTAFILQQMAFDTGVPIINGIIVAENEEQARERACGGIDRGAEFARAALEMAGVKVDLQARLDDRTPEAMAGAGEDADWDDFLDDEDEEEPWKS